MQLEQSDDGSACRTDLAEADTLDRHMEGTNRYMLRNIVDRMVVNKLDRRANRSEIGLVTTSNYRASPFR